MRPAGLLGAVRANGTGSGGPGGAGTDPALKSVQ